MTYRKGLLLFGAAALLSNGCLAQETSAAEISASAADDIVQTQGSNNNNNVPAVIGIDFFIIQATGTDFCLTANEKDVTAVAQLAKCDGSDLQLWSYDKGSDLKNQLINRATRTCLTGMPANTHYPTLCMHYFGLIAIAQQGQAVSIASKHRLHTVLQSRQPRQTKSLPATRRLRAPQEETFSKSLTQN
jgi:hypothetical protein